MNREFNNLASSRTVVLVVAVALVLFAAVYAVQAILSVAPDAGIGLRPATEAEVEVPAAIEIDAAIEQESSAVHNWQVDEIGTETLPGTLADEAVFANEDDVMSVGHYTERANEAAAPLSAQDFRIEKLQALAIEEIPVNSPSWLQDSCEPAAPTRVQPC